jgi:hypothetical protein
MAARKTLRAFNCSAFLIILSICYFTAAHKRFSKVEKVELHFQQVHKITIENCKKVVPNENYRKLQHMSVSSGEDTVSCEC